MLDWFVRALGGFAVSEVFIWAPFLGFYVFITVCLNVSSLAALPHITSVTKALTCVYKAARWMCFCHLRCKFTIWIAEKRSIALDFVPQLFASDGEKMWQITACQLWLISSSAARCPQAACHTLSNCVGLNYIYRNHYAAFLKAFFPLRVSVDYAYSYRPRAACRYLLFTFALAYKVKLLL